ncbi:MAG: acetate--CoA ligase family protein [Gemmatimonadetes bacterium]|nr:acetate--CoA ligase family protein [Gemmatimonadota bacterium]
MTMGHPLDPVLRPRGVAVVGASADATKRGYQVVRGLVESRYAGGVYPVNPRGGELFGLRVAPAVDAIEGDADLAVICTPAESVPGVLEACVRAGIRGAVILAVGFGERGPEGRALEARVLEIARRGGIRLAGPNTSGLLNLGIGLNLIGVAGLRRGPLALLVQSGNMALSLLKRAAERGGGVSVCVGVGNETDIRFDEYLEYLEGDHDTRAILMYVDGFRDGRRFLAAARRVALAKPIVLLKGGRSEAGRATARSHTGAIAGEYRTLQAALRQAGVIEAARSDELLAVAETLAGQPPVPAGTGVAVLADGGGQAVLAADALAAQGAPLATLSAGTQRRLRELLGPAAETANPVDVAGAGDRHPAVFAAALEALAADPAVGGVLKIGLFGGYALRFAASLEPEEVEAAAGMAAAGRRAGKPLVVHSIYAEAGTAPISVLREGGVPVIESVEVACAAVAAAVQRGRFLAAAEAAAPTAGAGLNDRPCAPGTDGGAIGPGSPAAELPRTARREGRSVLLEPEARDLLGRYGVPLAPADLCNTAASVREAARRLGGPVVLKVVSPELSHKSDAGGVALDLPDPESAAAAFEAMVARVAEHLAGAGVDPDIRGVLVSPMLPPPSAELLVGVRRDPTFGPVLTFGAGGTLVELVQDTALRVLPIGRGDAIAIQGEVRVALLLRGFRGRPPVDPGPIADVILAVARCALDHQELAEVEINPLFAYDDRVVAVDARAFLASPARSSSRPLRRR